MGSHTFPLGRGLGIEQPPAKGKKPDTQHCESIPKSGSGRGGQSQIDDGETASLRRRTAALYRGSRPGEAAPRSVEDERVACQWKESVQIVTVLLVSFICLGKGG